MPGELRGRDLAHTVPAPFEDHPFGGLGFCATGPAAPRADRGTASPGPDRAELGDFAPDWEDADMSQADRPRSQPGSLDQNEQQQLIQDIGRL